MDSWEDYGSEISKKSKKYNMKVPIHQLGFRQKVGPDIIDPRNMKQIKRRKKKKYLPKSSRQIFLSRLRLVIDVNDLPENIMSHEFQVNKNCHWAYVKKVFCRTRHKIFCYICLEEQIVAPQITFCGHIFCFHCILMHFQKSQNSTVCPVCKQYTQQSEMKTCEPIFDEELKNEQQIEFNLKYRVGSAIYNCETLSQDLNFNQIIRKRKEAIVQIFQKQQKQLMQQLAKTPQTDRNHHYLTIALGITRKKLEHSIEIMHKSGWIKLRENQKIIDNTVISFCQYQEIKRQQKYYQMNNGRSVYLHSLCRKYLEANPDHLPHQIKSKILLVQEEEFDPDVATEYKQLDHLLLGQDFEVAVIELEQYLDKEKNEAFKLEFEGLLVKREIQKEKEEAEAIIRNEIYEEELQERRRLQKMMETEYHDIVVPPILDPSEMNETNFPSLHSVTSQTVMARTASQTLPQLEQKQEVLKKKNSQFQLSHNSEEFPDLGIQLISAKSQVPKKMGGGKRNKKKQKKVDITAQIFAARNQDYEDY